MPETAVDQQREQIANRLGEPETLRFPSGWTTSTSWHRAQAAPSEISPSNPAEFDVLLGYCDDRDDITHHRVLFALYGGDLVAECECDGWSYRGWCAHVAVLWWRWCRDQLAVTNLDTGRTYLSPPWWFSVDGADAQTELPVSIDQPVATDGGSR
ncbi:hypothetical protein [Haloparvum sedimenti]|uniref:hypothetical protein n=1 Tax=Haloparvum sedimenti TaxID=1678448 RepID=UPI00071E7AB1|nr:hypothetical protein [Haloparvum sedimenti]